MIQPMECKTCKGRLSAEPVLTLDNVPLSAQGFSKTQAEALEQCGQLVLWECVCCGLVQLASPPVAYYRDVIRSAAVSPVLLQQKQRQFQDFIVAHHLQGKKILEVGCGRGEFLKVLHELDVKAFGIEHSQKSVNQCVAHGLGVTQGYLDSKDTQLRHGPFDAFVFLMFLEHIPAPREMLLGLANNLTEGAPGIIEVPSLEFLVRKNLLTEFIADHLMYFSTKTLSTLLTTSGFEVLDMRESRDDYVLCATVRKRKRVTLQSNDPAQGQLATDLRAYLKSHAGKRIAVWGAGHQALTSISVFGMASCLSMVVDSAPSKQGLFTPGSGLLVEPPTALLAKDIEVVIVMAGSYSTEIVQNILHDFPSVRHVAVAMEDHLAFPILDKERT